MIFTKTIIKKMPMKQTKYILKDKIKVDELMRDRDVSEKKVLS